MRLTIRNLILTAACSLTILHLCPSMQASTLTLTGNPTFGYQGILVGPYAATLAGDPDMFVFCLDLHIATYLDTSYEGNLSTPNTPAEEEAAFLAAYSLYLGAPSGGLVNTVEGPISMAIWQLMGTMGATPLDPAAQPYVQLAQSAYSSGLITDEFLRSVSIWTPNRDVTSQRFITAVRDDGVTQSAIPEPGTVVFLLTGVLFMALSRVRRRR